MSNQNQIAVRDETVPKPKWEFDASVTDAFDDMLKRSIPQYEVMRQLTFDLASTFVSNGTSIVDLGCSRGEALAPFVDKFGAFCRYVGVEKSPPMLAACRERFSGWISNGMVDIRDMDLRTEFPPVKASVILLVLTLQFVPIERRQSLLRKCWDHTMPGGCLVLVEKVLGSSACLDDLLVRAYYDLKGSNGYTQEQIEAKRRSLEGVLVPVTSKWNEDMLAGAGFHSVECFWRYLNFCGWIAVKR